MNKYLLINKIIIFFSSFFIATASLYSTSDNEIFKAMQDEIDRTMNELSLESLKKPYYVEYTLRMSQEYNVKSVLGAITESGFNKINTLSVKIRIGSYKFDNSNYLDFGLSFFGSGDDEEGFQNRRIPEEFDYSSLRRELWLATDAAYKQSQEILTKKETALKNRISKDSTYDFLEVKPEINIDTEKIPVLNLKLYEKLCNSLSEIFVRYHKIQSSLVSFEFLPVKTYYLNSEGMKYIKTEFFTGIEVVASTQTQDGMIISDFFSAYNRFPEELPSNDSLLKGTENVAKNIIESLNSPELDEPYSGPVLFISQSSAEIFAQTFAPNLVAQRSPLTETGLQENERYSLFQNKIGARVLPEFLSINDIPEKKYYKNTPLVGHFKIDDEGIVANELQLVRDGYLKTLLSSRTPTKRVRKSNGNSRGGSPMFSILEMSVTEDYPKKEDFQKDEKGLIEKMIKLCQDRELPFGILVKKVMDQNIMFTTLYSITSSEFNIPQFQSIPIIEAYKVFQDGKMELIRGCELKNLAAQSFKDIVAVGKIKYALNILAPAVVSPFISGGKQYVASSVIVPALLFEDCEIRPIEGNFPKLPIISNPNSN